MLPDLIARRAAERELTIWCAASSSGQEPYSLAMLIRENFPQLVSWKVHILATDLSTEILARAREGRYSQLEVNRGLPATLLVKYFQKRGCDWYLRDDIRNMVDYQIIKPVQRLAVPAAHGHRDDAKRAHLLWCRNQEGNPRQGSKDFKA